jgi:hypothetical protein
MTGTSRYLAMRALHSAADWQRVCERVTASDTLTEAGDVLRLILCPEPGVGKWVFNERDESLTPYDEPARPWAAEVNFGIG